VATAGGKGSSLGRKAKGKKNLTVPGKRLLLAAYVFVIYNNLIQPFSLFHMDK